MTIELFDMYCNLGPRIGSNAEEPESLSELQKNMAHYQIKNALIGHHFSIYGDVDVGNREAMEAVKDNENLWAVGSISPEFDGQSLSPQETLDTFIKQKGRMIRLRPNYRAWSIEDWCAKELLDALEERTLPITLSWDDTNASDLNSMLTAHPNLSCILIDLNYRNNRKIIPLLKHHKNLSVCISPRFSGHEVMEIFTNQVGPDKLIFGTRYPECEPGASISMLMYARIDEDAKRLIASENIKRLIEGVK